MVTSDSTDGLALSLSVNLTDLQPGQGVTITVDEQNTLAEVNNVPAADDWPLEGLSLGPCGRVNYPVGIAVFKGYYTSSNITGATPLKLYNPDAVYHCPMILASITAYEFQPSSDVASIFGSCDPNPCITDIKMNPDVAAEGYWSGSPTEFSNFSPGVYTVAGGGEWGALAILHFVVYPPPSPDALVFPPTLVRDVPDPTPVPWPGVVTYTEHTYEIKVNAGDEFAIGMFATIQLNFMESHDPNILDLVDNRIVEYDPGALNKYGTDWFLYKAINKGKTEIVFQYPLEYTKLFSVTIN